MYKLNPNQAYQLPVANSRNYLFLFIIWPFLAFLLALANYSQKESKRVVFFFLIYYGFAFVSNNIYADSFRYVATLQNHAALPFSEFFRIVGGLYSETTVDIMEPLISFFVSRFTTHHSFYFAIWTAIYGFFYLKSINILYERYQENPGWNTMIPMVFFIFILPITYVSSVRMWTAAWIFFYAAYHVVLNRNPKYLFLAFAASLVHWSFFTASAVLLTYYLLGNRNYIYVPLMLLSFVLPRLMLPMLGTISMRLGGAFLHRYEGYSNEGFIMAQHELVEQSSWFLQIGTNLVFYFLLLAVFLIQIRSMGMEKEQGEKNLYSFLILFLAFVNFGTPIPSFGGRFILVFFLFATFYLFLFFVKTPTSRINLLTLIGLTPMAIYIGVVFRISSESINPWIFSPILGSPLLAPVVSISDLLFH